MKNRFRDSVSHISQAMTKPCAACNHPLHRHYAGDGVMPSICRACRNEHVEGALHAFKAKEVAA